MHLILIYYEISQKAKRKKYYPNNKNHQYQKEFPGNIGFAKLIFINLHVILISYVRA
jgi:hypothetical protein